MKKSLLPLCLLLAFLCSCSNLKAQAVNTGDSLALVDLYNSTNGPGWVSHTNWLTAAPLSSWLGVTITNQRVTSLFLDNNKLSGTLPQSLGNLTQNNWLSLSHNQLTGNIPSTIGNIPMYSSINFSYNRLSGKIPASLSIMPEFSFLDISFNYFVFDGIEELLNGLGGKFVVMTFGPQADMPLHSNGNILSVFAGGTLSKNTYRWYNDDVLLSTKTGDSTFTINSPGNYSVDVSNSIILNSTITSGNDENFLLYSISKANVQDSLALVDLYNSLNGAGWTNNYNWLSAAPLATWYGVAVRRGRVYTLDLSSNNLSGSIPASLGDLSALHWLFLSLNNLTGNIPASLGNLDSLSQIGLDYNQLTGSIPSTLGNLSKLNVISLGYNQLTGAIPAELGNLNNLQSMFLSNNQLSGSIPSALSKISKLGGINLSFNQLTGDIPDSLYNLREMNGLLLNDNHLTGTISDSLYKFSSIWRLNLSNNLLTGKLPKPLETLTQLRVLDVSGNQLTGELPSFAQLSFFNELYIQNNKFTFTAAENIPVAIGRLLYSPQAKIPITRTGNLFSVSAGGTLPNDTFRLYKDGIVNELKVGDSTFEISSPGQYYISITNSIATKLALLSDGYTIAGLQLADSLATVTQNIAGTSAINIETEPYHKMILTVTPDPGVNGLSGNVTTTITIDPAVATYNNQPYVQRHFDIVPSNNPTTSMATVKLYFTQLDFDNYNAFPAHGLDLPSGPTDAAGIANLRVYQYHGFSTTSLPGSYSGPAIEIDPEDPNIVWNAAAQYWEVSFAVNGFSGFFVSSVNNALLPIRLLSFSAKMQDKTALLQWTTASEINTSRFEIQRSVDGNGFNTVATKMAAGNSSSNKSYQYADIPGNAPVYYYRLKMIDIDEKFSYSKVIKLSHTADEVFNLYPNPAKDFVTMTMAASAKQTTIKLVDMSGRVVQTILLPAGTIQYVVDVKLLSRGAYRIIRDGEKLIGKTLIVE